MKNVLITGNKGFIGSYLTKALQHQYNIVGLSREKGFDIADFSSLKNIETNIDIIIHTVSLVSDDYENSFNTNVLGTLNICKYAKEHGIKHIILLSTIFAFDSEDNGYFNSYGQTKKLSEELATAYCKEHGIALTILRLAQVYDDARLAQKGQAMLYYFIDTIKKEGSITLFGKTNPLRNYIHIEYLCDVTLEIIKEEITGTWNIVEEKSHTIAEIAYMLFELQQKQPDITYLTDKPNIPSVHIPIENNYKSKDITTISLKEGLKRILKHDK